MAADIVIADYGSGNVRSILNALRRVARDDQRVILTTDPAAVDAAERIVVPGVGAFAETKKRFDASGFVPVLERAQSTGRPILGVCVGMQIFADEGHEFGRCAGLGWIPGIVRQLLPGSDQKLPHFGWSPVAPADVPVFDGIAAGTQFYFVHSFVFDCRDPEDVAAKAAYGETFAAAVIRGSLLGTQFHPEKSDQAGLKLLANFCRWSPR